MKNSTNKALYAVFLLLGFGVGGLVLSIFNKNPKSTNLSDAAAWFGGIATLVAIVFVYIQIRNDQRTWDNEHKSNISIEALLTPVYVKSEDGGFSASKWKNLKIWAVNKKYGAGSYRFVGICKKEDYNSVKEKYFEDPEKIMNERESIYNICNFDMYNTEERYETIKGRGVSKTQTIRGEDLYNEFIKKASTDVSSIPVIIIYVDPFNNPTTLEFSLKKSEFSAQSNENNK